MSDVPRHFKKLVLIKTLWDKHFCVYFKCCLLIHLNIFCTYCIHVYLYVHIEKLTSFSRIHNLEGMLCFVVYVSYGYICMWLWAHAYHSTHVDIRGQISTVGPHLSTLLRQGLLCCIKHALASGMERFPSDKEHLLLLQRAQVWFPEPTFCCSQ